MCVAEPVTSHLSLSGILVCTKVLRIRCSISFGRCAAVRPGACTVAVVALLFCVCSLAASLTDKKRKRTKRHSTPDVRQCTGTRAIPLTETLVMCGKEKHTQKKERRGIPLSGQSEVGRAHTTSRGGGSPIAARRDASNKDEVESTRREAARGRDGEGGHRDTVRECVSTVWEICDVLHRLASCSGAHSGARIRLPGQQRRSKNNGDDRHDALPCFRVDIAAMRGWFFWPACACAQRHCKSTRERCDKQPVANTPAHAHAQTHVENMIQGLEEKARNKKKQRQQCEQAKTAGAAPQTQSRHPLLEPQSYSSTSYRGTSCFTLHIRFSSTHRKAPKLLNSPQ